MNINILIITFATVLVVAVIIISLIRSKKENSIPLSMISIGGTLLLSGIPKFSDNIFSLIAGFFSIKLIESEGPYWFRATLGFILVVLGVCLFYSIRQRIHIFNMYGIATQKDIDEPKTAKELKLTEYKIKEQIVDFVRVFDGGKKISPKTNNSICEYIENSAKKFSSKTKECHSSCFTGMAPIPYTIYAGTFLIDAKISEYFEYDSHNGDKYYKLGNSKKYKKLNTLFLEKINSSSNEVVLAISITHKVSNEDLAQFNMDVVRVELENPSDNIIKSKKQLNDYINYIYRCIDTEIKEKYPNLKTIHIAASIPSCISLEIGKIIGLRTNRICDVVAYHYISSSEPKYTFGIFVNGQNKGKLYKEN